MGFKIIQTNVEIGAFMEGPAGIRAAKDDRRDSRDCAELVNKLVEDELFLGGKAWDLIGHGTYL
jgi:hypothetical protein